MRDVAVRVENLGKLYRLGQTVGYKTLRESLTNAVTTPFRRRRAISREPSSTSDEPQATKRKSDYIWALRNVSFEVRTGEAVGIIGRNGSGKSTLLKVLSKITTPTEGYAEIYGRVGSLLEVGTGFHPELTGRENIYLNGAILGLKKAEIEQKFDEIVAFSEIDQFLDTPVKRYSSGMYVRLAFAIAAHLEPDILLVDEVLAVGDAQFQKKCLGKMEGVAREGRTVLFVSHNMAAVQTLCDRSILLEEGALRMDGSSHQVVRHYLGHHGENFAMRLWEDPSKAPGNELARLYSICIQDDSGKVTTNVRSDQEFIIEIKYSVKQDGLRPGTTAVVFNQEGTCVFSSMSNREEIWHGKPHPIGLYRSTCCVPKSLLPDGEYSLTVILWEGNYNLVCREDDVVRFHIVDAGQIRVDYFGGWAGVVRPLLQWHTEKVNSR
jgi:lipopolysaccharide transport system ATP-binding protein